MKISTILLNFYNLTIFLLSGLAYIAFKLHSRGKLRLNERFGDWKLAKGDYAWFHGASAGEVKGLIPIIKKFTLEFPKKKILLTSTSVNAFTQCSKFDWECKLLPFDSSFFIKRAIKNVNITSFIVSETEIWPILFSTLHKKNIPCFYVNALISDFTLGRYKLIKNIISNLFANFKQIHCIDENSVSYFKLLGAKESAIKLSGNTKYQTMPVLSSKIEIKKIETQYNLGERPLVTLGSIRPGEETFWFSLISKYKNICWIVAPRHKEKFIYFEKKLNSAKISFKKWSEKPEKIFNDGCNAVLLDTFGELEKVYAISSLAFVGATLIPGYGGHNPLEPAMYGVTPVLGPHHEKVKNIVRKLKKRNATFIVNSQADTENLISNLDKNNTTYMDNGQNAHNVWQSYQGTVDKILNNLKTELSQ